MSYSLDNRPFRARNGAESVRQTDIALRRALALGLFLLSGTMLGCTTTAYVRPQPPSLEEIVAQKQAGVPDEHVIARVAESEGRYYLRSEAVEYLLKNGVSRPVVDYLLGTAWAPSRVYYCDTCHEPWDWHRGYWAHHRHHWGG